MPARITLTKRSRWDFGSQTRCGLYLTHSAPGVNSIHGANRHRLDWGSDAKSRWPPALLMLQSQRNGGAPQLVAEVVFSGEGLERGKSRCNPLTKLPPDGRMEIRRKLGSDVRNVGCNFHNDRIWDRPKALGFGADDRTVQCDVLTRSVSEGFSVYPHGLVSILAHAAGSYEMPAPPLADQARQLGVDPILGRCHAHLLICIDRVPGIRLWANHQPQGNTLSHSSL